MANRHRLSLVLAALATVLGATLVPAAHAAAPTPEITWVCERTRGDDGILYLACSDWHLLLDDTPGENVRTWYVPTYSVPKTPQRAEELVRAVLCSATRPCQIHFDNPRLTYAIITEDARYEREASQRMIR